MLNLVTSIRGTTYCVREGRLRATSYHRKTAQVTRCKSVGECSTQRVTDWLTCSHDRQTQNLVDGCQGLTTFTGEPQCMIVIILALGMMTSVSKMTGQAVMSVRYFGGDGKNLSTHRGRGLRPGLSEESIGGIPQQGHLTWSGKTVPTVTLFRFPTTFTWRPMTSMQNLSFWSTEISWWWFSYYHNRSHRTRASKPPSHYDLRDNRRPRQYACQDRTWAIWEVKTTPTN